jgi:hypothetical protein
MDRAFGPLARVPFHDRSSRIRLDFGLTAGGWPLPGGRPAGNFQA